MEEIATPPVIETLNFLQIINDEIANCILLSESLKGDSLTLIATLIALIGIIGISAVNELLLVWVASSFLLITLIFIKILKDFFPTNKKQKDYENLLSNVGENKTNAIILHMFGAIIFNNFKPLYKSLILIFVTDLLIFFLSHAGLIHVADLGFPIFIFIVIVLFVLTVFSINLAKLGYLTMEFTVMLANRDKEINSNICKINVGKSAKITFFLLIIPFLILLFILIKINDVIPFIDNYSNLCKIGILLIIQLIFIAIFCEIFNKQIVSQILSKKIASLNSLKLLLFSQGYDLNMKITDQDIKYLYKSSNLINFKKEPSFFFFEKNSIFINASALQPGTEKELKKLLNDEIYFFLTP